jgi:hypothetical protein
LLYVFGGDLLQSYVNQAFRDGRLRAPIPNRGSNDFPIVQYADDTIIVLQADNDQLMVLKEILDEFSAFTGLKVNFHKSSMIPINVSQQETTNLLILDVSLLQCLSLILDYLWVLQDLQ